MSHQKVSNARTQTLNLNNIVVPNAKKDDDACSDDIDTGETNGSGNLVVRARSARKDGKGVRFQDVQIEATNPENNPGKGYADWERHSLIEQATEMLRKDYCK